jgi:hypothetical protein
MALERLARDGFLLPKRARGKLSLEGSIRKAPFLLLGAAGFGSCLLMYLGDGGAWTWTGVLAFHAFLVAFLAVSIRAVRRQVAEVDRLVRPRKATGVSNAKR